jgi:hypothetical protein
MTPHELVLRHSQMSASDRELLGKVVACLLSCEETNAWVHDQLRFIDAKIGEHHDGS